MKPLRENQTLIKGKSGKMLTDLKKSIPLTLMALPGILLMIVFKYLPLSGIILAFKRFNVRDGIFGSEFIGWNNFKFLFM